jgi:hypothetical protein
MPRLPVVSGNELVRLLEASGFRIVPSASTRKGAEGSPLHLITQYNVLSLHDLSLYAFLQHQFGFILVNKERLQWEFPFDIQDLDACNAPFCGHIDIDSLSHLNDSCWFFSESLK